MSVTCTYIPCRVILESPKGGAGDLILNLVTALQGVAEQETYALPQHSSQSGSILGRRQLCIATPPRTQRIPPVYWFVNTEDGQGNLRVNTSN
jgi:hypothetical protein